MSTIVDPHPLLACDAAASDPGVPETWLEELRDLAGLHDHCMPRSRHLHEQLRKMLGQERLVTCLLGIQTLALADDPAGARLLAALLDANTPGALLMPRVRRLRSCGRMLNVDSDLVGTEFLSEWQDRLAATCAACARRLGGRADADAVSPAPLPHERPPLPLLRRTLALLTPASASTPRPPDEDLLLLAAVIRLECDAYQERVSRLAGSIDPFRVTAVMRALPLLNRADAEVRDLNLLAGWLEAGDYAPAFQRRVPTAWDVLDEGERPRLIAALQKEPALAPLAAVHAAFLAAPQSVRQLAGPTARLLVVGQALVRAGLRERPLPLLEAVRLVLTHSPGGTLRLPLDDALEAAVSRCLLAARHGGQDDLAGLEVRAGVLTLQQPRLALGDRIWRHDLPTLAELQAAADPSAAAQDGEPPVEERVDTSAAAVKQMVMNNVGSVSILLGFLRNQRVTSIPGLVAEVVRRTRSPRVLEVIMGDRSLYGGHANKDVPLALIESPVNVSIKSLRRFIHVKYISKTDLRRLSRDTARLRKDVCKEIEAYLESLT